MYNSGKVAEKIHKPTPTQAPKKKKSRVIFKGLQQEASGPAQALKGKEGGQHKYTSASKVKLS